mgnify:CR=1 FL=1
MTPMKGYSFRMVTRSATRAVLISRPASTFPMEAPVSRRRSGIQTGSMVAVRIVTPDLRGLNYLRAHRPLLTDEKFHYGSHLTFAGLARPFHAIDEMDHQIGGFDGLVASSRFVSPESLSACFSVQYLWTSSRIWS